MRATGIVRRVDELGRVVIPKEIRRTLRIREGDPMEIFTSRDGEVVFKKYSPLDDIAGAAKDFVSIIHRQTGFSVYACDRDRIVAIAEAGNRGILNQGISENLFQKIRARQTFKAYRLNNEYPIPIIDGRTPEGYAIQIIAPIVVDDEEVGAFIAITNNLPPIPAPIVDATALLVEGFAELIGAQLES